MSSDANQKPSGIIPPLTTPFTQDGRVYEKGLRELLVFLADRGVHGLFICGTYGSGPIMTLEERKQVHRITVEEVGTRVKVIAHVGTASTEQSVELAKHAEKTGASCVAAISPYYHHHDERSVLRPSKRWWEQSICRSTSTTTPAHAVSTSRRTS